MVLKNFLLMTLLVFALPLAYGGEGVPTAEDPVLEKRVMALSEKLRCLVCQNQTIADSNSGLAIDLKNQVREKMQEGKSDEEILDYMVERYGDFVLFLPQVKSNTWLLWFGPFIFLGLGVVLLIIKLKQRRKLIKNTPILSDEDHARAAAMLSGTNERGRL